MIEKKAYETPELVEIGDIEKVTQGEGWWSFKDFFVFGLKDPFGKTTPKSGS